MKVEFGSTRLRKCYQSHKDAVRAWGEEVARKYVERVNLIYACSVVDDLRSIPQLRLHPLKGNRAGEWAMTLTGMMRLIVTFREESTGTVVRIEEVSKHYED